ncbi:MAG: U32 family peptidase [Firmicutes bacterium]|nr:U32 family peptidase [Bacillota bacterium]
MVELLAPAGKMENLKFAFLYGADAVYFGGQNYSLRANAKNFNLDEIKEATIYAHSLNKKVYVTVNIVFHDEDFLGLDDYLRYLDEINVDGIIASDISVIKKAKELNTNFQLILSTQASVLNSAAVKFWQDLGVTKVVLAREASREDIKQIKEDTGIEIETFIHGAMCTSFSGKCILSNYMTQRDSNRGGCAQICRWPFTVTNQPNLTITPKDLNMLNYIEDMINIGIDSFKIEGRMRSIYYVATVILVYRRVIDKILNKTLTEKDKIYYLNILNRCANRDSTPQFYDKLPGVEEQYFIDRDEASNQDFLGLVIDYDEEKQLVKLEQRNYFKKGDIVQFFGPNIKTFNHEITNIYDENLEEIDVARHPQMIVYLKLNQKVNKNDMMRIKIYDI